VFIIRSRVDKLMEVPLTRSSRSDALSRIPGKSTNVSGGAAGHERMRQILSMQPAGGLTVSRSCLHNSGFLHWLLHYLLSQSVHLSDNCAFRTTAQLQCEAQGITRSSTGSSSTFIWSGTEALRFFQTHTAAQMQLSSSKRTTRQSRIDTHLKMQIHSARPDLWCPASERLVEGLSSFLLG
jgi:hypothetical protein